MDTTSLLEPEDSCTESDGEHSDVEGVRGVLFYDQPPAPTCTSTKEEESEISDWGMDLVSQERWQAGCGVWRALTLNSSRILRPLHAFVQQFVKVSEWGLRVVVCSVCGVIVCC